jgi:hypothetical protein
LMDLCRDEQRIGACHVARELTLTLKRHDIS